ncbi:GNAT family N-acetyltransferase [Cognatishimia sp. MH4019]|uniref:GNAT family N-acetyltransferase n=1 Tax=Cognatishimia sp. MH4019 TaxID=2854030 RepID=UPI001CD313F8|nr:GNAT family N-acetyltransferase [Cognatishimia sp. MH4019]
MSVEIRPFTPEDADWLTRQHGVLYARDEGFDETLEPLVAQILAGFVAKHDPNCERGWIAWEGETRLGSIFCVRLDAEAAKLRLFLLVPEARGSGLGRRLLETCMGFAREAGCARMQLWTHAEHEAACALCARNGFRRVSRIPVHSFGRDLTEEQWEIDL